MEKCELCFLNAIRWVFSIIYYIVEVTFYFAMPPVASSHFTLAKFIYKNVGGSSIEVPIFFHALFVKAKKQITCSTVSSL